MGSAHLSDVACFPTRWATQWEGWVADVAETLGDSDNRRRWNVALAACKAHSALVHYAPGPLVRRGEFAINPTLRDKEVSDDIARLGGRLFSVGQGLRAADRD